MYTYLALGDSYTIGEQVPYELNFPNQTVQLLRKAAVPVSDPVIIATTGFTTDELQTAIRERGLQEQFSFVSLLIGVNNQYRGRSVENYREEFTQLLDQAIFFAGGNTSMVFVLSIPDWGVTPFAAEKDARQIATEIDAYNDAAAQIAASKNVSFIGITESTRLNGVLTDYLAPDGLHPSQKEYTIWAARLAEKIQEVLPRA
jgi:lysophospholipase L1-like esterase